jgi:hypothetical protein
VEFAISSMVLLLLAMGLIDLSRAFYYSVALQGAAREGARHGAWFNTAARQNNFLDDADVMTAVTQALSGAGITNITQIKSSGCLAPTDGNSLSNKPYPQAAYPTTPQAVYVYVCYKDPYGNTTGTRPAPPPDDSWKLGDINVAILMNFQLITPLIQGLFGQGIDLAYNEHFTIQGKP